MMKNIIKYKGFNAKVEFDAEEDCFFGHVLGLPKELSLTFEGDSVTALKHDFFNLIDEYFNLIDEYLFECKKRGVSPAPELSGKILLRLPPQLHTDLMIAAQSNDQSLNAWITDALVNALNT